MREPISDLVKGFIEKLAALEHDQWIEWASSVMATETLSEARRIRWKTLMVPYSDLPEGMKRLDRVWAEKVFDLFQKNVDD